MSVSDEDWKNLDNDLSKTALVPTGRVSGYAGYTYALQFLMHDIVGRGQQLPRTPFVDLESLYGSGFLTDRPDMKNGMFMFSDTLEARGEAHSTAGDVRRKARASLIADPRNDHNLLIAQFHVALQKLHNRAFDEAPPELSVRRRYFWARSFTTSAFRLAVENDLLREFVPWLTFKHIVLNRQTFLFRDADSENFRVPELFSHGVARFGHSLVNSAYLLNDSRNGGAHDLERIFKYTWLQDLGGAQAIPQKSVVDWRHFFNFKAPGISSAGKTPTPRLAIDLSFAHKMRTCRNRSTWIAFPWAMALLL